MDKGTARAAASASWVYPGPCLHFGEQSGGAVCVLQGQHTQILATVHL